MENTISIIIPIYKVEEYLPRCINSIISQTYKNLEIILVDDGSPDKCPTICDEYAQTDNRIKVIHKTNGGLSSARNAGLEMASGEWIAFLDSDDWVEPKMYEVLYDLAVRHNADISSCSSRNCYPGTTAPPIVHGVDTEIEFDTDGIIKDMLHQTYIRFEVWNKLWKRSLIGDVRFKVGQVAEDVYFDRVLFMRTNKIVHTTRVLHNYLVDRPGATNSTFKVARLGIFDEFDAWIEYLKGKDKNTQADMVGCIAITYAMSAYWGAINTKQDDNIIEKTRNAFEHFYDITKHSPYRKKYSIELFHLSPKLYNCLVSSKLYKKIVGIRHNP